MKVTRSVENYNKIVHNQKKYSEFESVLSDKMKESEKHKSHMGIMKTAFGMSDEQIENIKWKFSYKELQNPFGPEARSDYIPEMIN